MTSGVPQLNGLSLTLDTSFVLRIHPAQDFTIVNLSTIFN